MFHLECNKYKPQSKANNYNVSVMSFGKWLIKKRKERGLTQGQLATQAGISTSYVSTLEREQPHLITNARPQPTAEIVENIAMALGVPVDEARIEAGYFGTRRPQNAEEFLEALNALGISGFTFGGHMEGISDLSPERYQDLLESVRIAIAISLRRK